jgi:methylmalonyl-CoA mutase
LIARSVKPHHYEQKKHDGSYPIIGVNTFRNPHGEAAPEKLELIRSTDDEKQSQLKRLRDFQRKNSFHSAAMLERLKRSVIGNENVFAVLMDAVRVCSVERYRRNM